MTSLINTLRSYLKTELPEETLNKCFDLLSFEYEKEKKELKVLFPHFLFFRYFADTLLGRFEAALKIICSDVQIVYPGHAWSKDVLKSKTVEATAPPYVKAPAVSDNSKNSHPLHNTEITLAPYASGYERYSFESFLVNKKNDFPFAAAKNLFSGAFCESTLPLVIYGQSGSGKTHLLGAIANDYVKKNHGKKFYFGNAAFLAEVPKKLLTPDKIKEELIIIDDMQRLPTNDSSLLQIFHDNLIVLIDSFKVLHRILVVSLNCHPDALVDCPQALKSRLIAGLNLELKKPDLDIRRQYVQLKNLEYSLALSRESVLSLAQRFQDFRSIDGSLNRLVAYRAHVGTNSADDLAAVLGADNIKNVLTPKTVIMLAAKYFSIPFENITGKDRSKTAATARQICMHLCRDLLGLSLVRLGHFFGNRDHSSIIYSLKKINEKIDSNKDVHKHVSELKKMCLTYHD